MKFTKQRRGASGPFASLKDFFEQTQRNQADVAAEVGISESHMSNIVNGARKPSYDVAVRLAQVTNVPMDAVGRNTAA